MALRRSLLVLLAIGAGVALAVASMQVERSAVAPTATATIEATWVPTATPRPPPTPTVTAPGQAALEPIVLAEGAAITEEGTYVIELETKKLWKMGSGYSTSVHWLPERDRLVKVRPNDPRLDEPPGIEIVDLTTGLRNRILDGEASGISLSPDGKEIAFTRYRPDASIRSIGLLYVLSVDGGVPRRLTDTEVRSIAWSPKGNYIAFQREERGIVHLLHVASGESAGLEELGLQRPISFAWSPDGETLAVAGANGLRLYTLSTGRIRDLPGGHEGGAGLAWSPDGSTLLRGERFADHVRISVIDLVSGDERTSFDAFGMADWSPNGEWMAYLSSGCQTGIWDVYATRRDGSETKRLTTPESLPRKSIVVGNDWAPVGSLIAFSTLEKVIVVDGGSAQTQVLAEAEGVIPLVPASWSPDGRYLALSVPPGRGLCN